MSAFGFNSLRDLPNIEALEDAGLLDKAQLRDDALPSPIVDDDEDGGRDLGDEDGFEPFA